MIPLLTKYLLRYKRVSIPHIGSFELVQEPPQLEPAEQLCRPPSFTTAYVKRDGVPEHQSRFFSARASAAGLSQFGEQLHDRLRKGPVQWKGFGILSYAADEIRFEPQPLSLPALQAVPAPKVVRQEAVQVLVGDQSLSRSLTPLTEKEELSRSWELVVGLILLVLAVIAAIALLYPSGFSPMGTGLRLRW